ncbi:hypothetical protein [Nitrosomonas sp.]|uniref:hypothetical protein n=1 Tax=Nitrosomonas sp. TaxID=42353 RepID=UPI0025D53798|nr:hypothetical protein [Nitrosomonas sp.]MBV6447149.1 hypothetical protein [Nitrosomonas sp.]
MISVSELIEKVNFLRIPPQALDAIFPHGPVYSRPLFEFMTAGVIRDISAHIRDEGIAEKVKSIGKNMASTASRGLIQGWEEGDDLCPVPIKWPFPPRMTPITGPHPEPWSIDSAKQIVLANLLVNVADITINRELSTQLRDVAFSVVKMESNYLIEDFGRNINQC